MDGARRADQLVRRIAAHVKPRTHPSDLARDRPNLHGAEGPDYVRVIQIDLDSTELRELRDLPQNDGRDAPAISMSLQLGGGGRAINYLVRRMSSTSWQRLHLGWLAVLEGCRRRTKIPIR